MALMFVALSSIVHVCSLTNWSPSNLRNGNISTDCTGDTPNRSLVFGLDSAARSGVVSRSVTTNQLYLSSVIIDSPATDPEAQTVRSLVLETEDSILGKVSGYRVL